MEEMMKNMDFYVTPVLNVDGYIFSWKDNTVSARNSLWIVIEIPPLCLSSQAADEQDTMRGLLS